MSSHTAAARKSRRNKLKQYKWEAGSQKGRCKWVEGKKVCTRPPKKGSGRWKNVGGLAAMLGGFIGIGTKIVKDSK